MWREIIITLLICWIPEAALKHVCSYHDVAEYLNISSNKERLLYTMPKKDWESPLEVGLDFTLVAILSVQEKLQVVTFYIWTYVSWTNEFLSWNPSDFCNISTIILPAKLFWIPDIFIDERADDNEVFASPFVSLSSTGQTLYFQAYRLTSTCNLDIRAFPFDKQKCNLTLTPSVYQGDNILLKSVKTSKMASQESHRNYLTDGEWEFEELKIVERFLDYGTLQVSGVIYEITMSRQSVLYVLVLIVPTFALFLLDMAVSYAVATPGEKIAFKVTLILQISFLSLILNDRLPATSDDPPVIAMFFSGISLFMFLGILENAFVLYLREKKSKLLCLAAFVKRFKRKEEKESEDPVTNLGPEMPKENDQRAPLPLAENSTAADTLAFLKHLNVELQQIKKHLALEKCQIVPEQAIEDEILLLVEKGLYYTRLILSLIFLAFIIIRWTN